MRGHICADLIFSCNKLGGLGGSGARMKTRYLIIYLGGKKKIYIFPSILTRLWVISQPGDACISIQFDHISCPQHSPIPFLSLEIPINFLLEKIKGKKSHSSTVSSQGLHRTKEIIFEMENKPSVEKTNSRFSLLFTDLSKFPPELFQTFQAGMFNTSPGMPQHQDQSFSSK